MKYKTVCHISSIILLALISLSALYGQSTNPEIEAIQYSKVLTIEKGRDFKSWAGSIYVDDDETVWVSAGNLLYTFDGVNTILRASGDPNKKLYFKAIFEINDTLYFSHGRTPTYYFPYKTNKTSLLKSKLDFRIMSLCKTSDGKIFVSTKDGRIIHWKDLAKETIFEIDQKYQNLDFAASFESLIQDQENQDYLWYYYKNNLFYINSKDGSYDVFDLQKEANLNLGVKPDIYYSVKLIQQGDYLYFGSEIDGLIRFNKKTKKVKSFKAIPPYFFGENEYNGVIEIIPYGDSLLLLGGSMHKIFDAKNEIFHEMRDSKLRRSSIPKFGVSTKRDNNIYMNNFDGGLCILSPNNNKFKAIPIDDQSQYTGNQRDKEGNIWSILDGVLIQTNQEKDTIHTFSVVNKFGGSVSNTLLVDDNNKVWLGTETGLLQYNISDETYKRFDRFDGLEDQDWTSGFTAKKNKNGNIIVTANKIYNSFHQDSLSKSVGLEVPYVYKYEILDESTFRLEEDNSSIDLEPTEDYFTLHFTSKDIYHGRHVRYKYKLLGHDTDWRNSKIDNLISYNRVPPGTYTFKVKAYTEDGLESEINENIKVKVKAEWFESLWFKILILALLLLLTYLFYKVKVGSLKRELALESKFQNELAQVKLEALRSQMNPHFLFNCLNSIDNFILNNNPAQASEYLSKFSKLIRNTLEFSKRNLISLKEEIEMAEVYIKMEQMRFENKFDYHIHIEEDININELKIPPLILQPYIENSIWHGLLHKDEKGQLDVRIGSAGKFIQLEIEDDGIGRHKSAEIKSKSASKRKSYGMKITKERIDIINELDGFEGHVKTVDKMDESGNPIGTKVILKLLYNSTD